jgi:hypothetical protein
LYDPSTGTWSRTGNLITGRYWHTATQLRNGNVLVAGGLVDVAPNMGQIEGSAELYDPVGGAWTRTADLNEVHSQHTATRMQDGRVLVASGDSPYDSYDDPGTAEIYDPDTATWSNTGNLRVIRNGHTATLLPSGKVLVTGGVYFSAMNGAELYDPVSGTWAPTGDVITPRFFGHTATLLSDGNVLVAAGARETDNPAPLDSAELYDDGPVSAQVQTAVEYGTSCPACWDYGDYNEYFVTSFPDEIAALDGGAFGGEWHRTGETFKVWTGAASGALPTCRFFNATFINHFYTPYAAECAWVQANPTWHWQYEGIAFYLQVPDGNGNCPTGTTILYRLFNNGMGGALVHRLTTSAATFNQMRAAGWVFEGDGRTFAFACVPQ